MELMLAVTVFVISIASVAYLFIGAQASTDYSMSKVQATLLAREKIEEKREERYENGFYSLSTGTDADLINLGGRSYDTTTITSEISEEVLKVEVTVDWTSRGRAESISLTEHLAAWDEVIEVEEEEEE